MEAPNGQSSEARHREGRTSTQDVWEESVSVVPEEPSLCRNGHQITYDVTPITPIQPAACSRTLQTSESGGGQMTAPDVHHERNLMPPPNSVCMPNLMPPPNLPPIQPAARSHTLQTSESGAGQMTAPDVHHERNLMPPPNSACVPNLMPPPNLPNLLQRNVELEQRSGAVPAGATMSGPSPQEGATQARRGRRSRGRGSRRGCYQPAGPRPLRPIAPAPLPLAQSPELLQEHFPHQAPPTQQRRRRPWQNVNQGRQQGDAEYAVLLSMPAEHRVEMVPPMLFNPPAIQYMVQRLHWSYLPKIAPVYGDPRRMPGVIEVLPGGAQVFRVPRPAHQMRLSHVIMKYSAPQLPPPPFIRPVEPPLKYGGHERTNDELIQMADRATDDVAASVAISLSVREDPLSDAPVPAHQHRHQARRVDEQAEIYELPLDLSLGRSELGHPAATLSQPKQMVPAATAGPSRVIMEVPQAAGAGPSQLMMQAAATGNLQAPVANQQMKSVSWSTPTSSHQLPFPLPLQHAEQIHWYSDNASHVSSRHREAAIWPTAGPSNAPSQHIVPHIAVSELHIPYHTIPYASHIVDDPQAPTQQVGVPWSTTVASQVASQPKKEESLPIIGTSQSRTGTVITSVQMHPQKAGHSQQINRNSHREWPTEEDFPPPKLSDSSNDSSSSSDGINLHRRKQNKSNIKHQNNGH